MGENVKDNMDVDRLQRKACNAAVVSNGSGEPA